MTAPSDPAPLDPDTDLDDCGEACRLQLAGWEGTLGDLLTQARAQRIDLTQISVADLLSQVEARLQAAISARTVI